jgi:dihydrolipoamide dehydrogenase
LLVAFFPKDYPVSEFSGNGKRLVVLGAGPGGYPAAFLAADLGFNVTLIDERVNPGGVCLYVGCIPSKALLHVAKLLNEAKEAAEWGISFGEPKIDIDKLRAWKDSKVVNKLTGGLGVMSKAKKVKFVQGRGSFTSANSIEVTSDKGKESIEFDYAIVATGSRPAIPKALDIKSERVIDSTGALALKDVPKKLLVIGGGYIGLEMGTVYAALGSKVTVVEMTQGLLPGADRDLAEQLQRVLTKKFDQILLNTRVDKLTEEKNGVKVKLIGLDLKEPEQTFDKVLISVGRVPNSQGFGLDKLGVELDERGNIKVDAQRRTNVPTIYAIGDVAGGVALAHKATHEGRVAVEAMAGKPVAWDPATIPAVVFTDPEVAWAGITETEALNRNIEHKVAKFPWAASGRATTLGRTDGLTKIIVDPHSERILGIGICGPGAGELIAEAALAVEMGATVTDVAHTVHPHPTLSETVMEAAELYFGHSAHYIARK